MTTLRKIMLAVLVAAGMTAVAPQSADAGIFVRRVAPVRTAARVALPPYPVARRVAFRPVYRPIGVYRPVIYGGGFGGGVSVWW